VEVVSYIFVVRTHNTLSIYFNHNIELRPKVLWPIREDPEGHAALKRERKLLQILGYHWQ
jgi:hypothetical protein